MPYVTSVERLAVQRGIQQGEHLGEATVLACLLNRRFGTLAPEIPARFEAASLDQLEYWVENILDAATLEDVFKA